MYKIMTQIDVNSTPPGWRACATLTTEAEVTEWLGDPRLTTDAGTYNNGFVVRCPDGREVSWGDWLHEHA